jgi:hypothetical protein
MYGFRANATPRGMSTTNAVWFRIFRWKLQRTTSSPMYVWLSFELYSSQRIYYQCSVVSGFHWHVRQTTRSPMHVRLLFSSGTSNTNIEPAVRDSWPLIQYFTYGIYRPNVILDVIQDTMFAVCTKLCNHSTRNAISTPELDKPHSK